MTWEFDYRQEQMKHNGLAIALLKRDIASSEFVAHSPSTINTIFLLSFLAVRSSIHIQMYWTPIDRRWSNSGAIAKKVHCIAGP